MIRPVDMPDMIDGLARNGPAVQGGDAVHDLLKQIAAAVRSARTGRGFSRRELSELSGVSSRHLANLEGGEGNISIGLLKRVAIALGVSMTDLIGPDDGLSEEARNVALGFARTDAATRARILELLDPQRFRDMKAERICLVGLRGAGKSTMGNLIAREYGVPFVEMNSEIEKSAGIPIPEIFSLYGEDGYRQLEADAVTTIIQGNSRMVLAASGGIVAHPETYARILSRFHTIWLEASPLEHMDRVRAQGDLRPIQGNPRALLQLRQILKSREPDYRRTDFHISTAGKPVDKVFGELRDLVASNGLIAGMAA